MTSAISLHIDKLVPGGDGLARHEGRVVFVPGVLPGEDVTVEIVEAKKDFARARLREVVTTSPDRVAPPCALAGVCGGCDWLHIDPAAQARLKVELVRDSLRRMAGFDLPDLEIETGTPLGYRNRIQAHVNRAGQTGFLGRGGREFVRVAHCPVAHPALAPVFAETARPHGPDRFLAYGHTDAGGQARMARADEALDAEIVVRVLDRDIAFPVRGFFQSNLEMTRKLIPYVLDGLEGGARTVAFDLYSGVGLFGAFLKDRFERVVCIEFNRHALAYARRNVGESGLFFQEALEKVVTTPGGNPLDKVAPRAAVVDPPREGLDKTVRAWLVARPIPQLVYVSCNPVTLARDLKELLAGPYELEDMRVFDFYPQTSHIEAVAKLRVKTI
ncbi:MAG TPA: class I SAM-dependent RNA methyltransferase [Fibrobacteria bacterium]|nr:class I SAM-dependent RNA methyltransferase [Fibrobacteria bacterium]